MIDRENKPPRFWSAVDFSSASSATERWWTGSGVSLYHSHRLRTTPGCREESILRSVWMTYKNVRLSVVSECYVLASRLGVKLLKILWNFWCEVLVAEYVLVLFGCIYLAGKKLQWWLVVCCFVLLS